MKITTFLVSCKLGRNCWLPRHRENERFHADIIPTFLWDGGDFSCDLLTGLLGMFGDARLLTAFFIWSLVVSALATVGVTASVTSTLNGRD